VPENKARGKFILHLNGSYLAAIFIFLLKALNIKLVSIKMGRGTESRNT